MVARIMAMHSALLSFCSRLSSATAFLLFACLGLLGPQESQGASNKLGFHDSEFSSTAPSDDGFAAASDPATDSGAEPDWDRSFKTKIPSDVKFGVLLDDSDYALHAADLFTAASLTKIFTAATALKVFGAEYQFATEVTWKKIDAGTISSLRILGNGDPSWKSSTLMEIAKRLREKGVRRIIGGVTALAKDERWNQFSYPPGWNPVYQRECYASLAHAFNINENCATLAITSLHQSHWIETGVGTSVELKLRPGRSTSLRVERSGSSYMISGTFKGLAHLQLPIHDTAKWVEGALRSALRAQGVAFENREITDAEKANASSESLTHLSIKLSEILKRFLKDSICFYGDALVQDLGSLSKNGPNDLRAAGLEEIARFNQETNGHPDELIFFDGGGLSTQNKTSARAVFSALENFKKQLWFPDFWNALSIAGKDGTLKDRMKETAAQNRLRAKTGTLIGFYHLAGYVPVMNAAKEITAYRSFVILGESTEGEARKGLIRGRQNQAGAALSRWILQN
ncbi:MAG: D-alanyl-D-alanine carboxypeptidase/D-alanyl-D-alanine-endopeptidase [Methylotenera sp.]|nr:D-alanyl-D-alanine carboxypeptidase/D-alanyl-D-alanine-endopeptidase [Oligoflexia bacterium]